MKFAVLTIFPELFVPFWEHGIIRRAVEGNKISASTVNIRDFATDRHHSTDDSPYGGGCGMVMNAPPLAAAIRAVRSAMPGARTILTTPQGRVFTQDIARELAESKGLIFVCGRYEGIDERICQDFTDDEISIGDYVMTGGELAAMVVIDAVTRLIPGVLGGEDSAQKDSFSQGLLEHAHYTRPRVFEGCEVPEVLLSGHHKEIEKWRLESSLIRTFLKRRDLLKNTVLNTQETEILKKWCLDIENILRAQSLSGADPLSGKQ
ncbi:MAG: tRNA (guanosine(37)-N1)-methyltransferase TrmD [Desulfobacteraceae bacterium IS3]|nr:MAG: tRNA (guanosine(37)-N1)-methyltransferase TrmD [Desulfobacteraceae bacterium IS3]